MCGVKKYKYRDKHEIGHNYNWEIDTVCIFFFFLDSERIDERIDFTLMCLLLFIYFVFV